jgi:hypothetical protein
MTTSIPAELERRGHVAGTIGPTTPTTRRGRGAAQPRTSFAASLAARIRESQVFVSRIRFPHPMYQADPVGFFHNVLGIEPWSRQVEMLEAIRDYRRVAIRSGHKIAKSNTAAGIALWFYCSFFDARVIMSSTTSRQVDQILWRELRMMRARAGRCLACKADDPEGLRIPRPCPHSTLIEGEIGDLARTGLKAPDFREIVGFTAREAEAVAGISGANLLYLLDESSGIDQAIFDAIEGNRAGGARIVLFGNPTRNEGEFYEAFHSKSRLYHGITISSEETPNAVSGRVIVPGLATREWIDEKRDEWGEDSPLFKIRIKGIHATHEDGRIFSVHTIEQAEARWADAPEAGRLYLGVDVAGESGKGDETMFAPRRGLKLLSLIPRRGLTAEGHVVQIVGVLKEYRLPREVPVVVVDAEGADGSKVARLLDDYLDRYPDAFELVRVYAHARAVRQSAVYDKIRDELAANLRAWFRDGGAIVEDTKLAAELHVFEELYLPNGRVRITPKETIRKTLGRSPDRYDALALSCWEPLSLRVVDDAPAPRPANDDDLRDYERTLDPYAAGDQWRGRS